MIRVSESTLQSAHVFAFLIPACLLCLLIFFPDIVQTYLRRSNEQAEHVLKDIATRLKIPYTVGSSSSFRGCVFLLHTFCAKIFFCIKINKFIFYGVLIGDLIWDLLFGELRFNGDVSHCPFVLVDVKLFAYTERGWILFYNYTTVQYLVCTAYGDSDSYKYEYIVYGALRS